MSQSSIGSKEIERVEVTAGGTRYPVIVGHGVLSEVGTIIADECRDLRRAFVVSNPVVSLLWLQRVIQGLQAAGCAVDTALIEDGEHAKGLQTVARLYESLASGKHDRRTVVIGVGGGVVGDVAGFTAATFMRGVRVVHVPTTLLAQVDSSIGGKTAVNHAGIKNLVGAFHQPVLVLADTSTLGTLPPRVFSDGMAEAVKSAVIQGPGLFEFIEENARDIASGEGAALLRMVAGCVRLKASIVALDERDGGQRVLLNLGHTFAHALESALGWSRVSHGRAVAVGLCLAAALACELGISQPSLLPRLESLLSQFGLPTSIAALGIPVDPAAIQRWMGADKKRLRGAVRFVVPAAIGDVRIIESVPPEIVMRILDHSCGATRA